MKSDADSFVTLSFALADYRPDSACAIAIVRVDHGVVTARQQRLIRPPRQAFVLSHLHGIRWEDVASAPPFRIVWRNLSPLLDGASCLVARNAEATLRVLRACCATAGLAIPTLPVVHPGRLLRATRTTPVPAGAPRLHDPLTAAEEAARVTLAAQAEETARDPGARKVRRSAVAGSKAAAQPHAESRSRALGDPGPEVGDAASLAAPSSDAAGARSAGDPVSVS